MSKYEKKEKIENSIILSSMSYVEAQSLKEIEDNMKNFVINDKVLNFITRNNAGNKINPNNIGEIVNKNVEELSKTEDFYNNVIKKRFEFYKKFKNELAMPELPEEDIYNLAFKDSIIELRRNILKLYIEENEIKQKGCTEECKELLRLEENKPIQVEVIDKYSENKEELRAATREMWERFTPFFAPDKFYEEFTRYNAKNQTELTVKTNQNGLITAGNIAGYQDGAMLVGWVVENGKKVLHVSFRGTENKAKPFMSYFVENYPNMERQYNNLEPIIDKILLEANKQFKSEFPNEKMEVSFDGHSLGAAIAEKALQKHEDSKDIKFSGVFIANPGSRHYFQKTVNFLDDLTFKVKQYKPKNDKFFILGYDPVHEIPKKALGFSLGLIKASILVGSGLYNYTKGATMVAFQPIVGTEKYDYKLHKLTGGVAKFLAVGLDAMVCGMWSLADDIFLPKRHYDPRGVTINSAFDNVPQIGGALADRRLNKEVTLTDTFSYIENRDVIRRSVQFEYHKMEHYLSSFKKVPEEKLKEKLEPKVRSKASALDIAMKLRDNLPLANLAPMRKAQIV